MVEPSSNAAARTRQALLARTASRPLPLGRGGHGLRRRVREAGASPRAHLLQRWADALRELHAAGWGTEDPVAAAIVTVSDHVQFLPDLIWPLGTLTARRPIAAWLDVVDALAWLDGAGLGRDAAPSLARLAAPWTGWPQLDGPSPLALIGPPAELAALATHANVPWLPAADLQGSSGRAWALEALEARAAWLVPVADPSWLHGLRTLPGQTLRAGTVGGALPFDADDLDALGIPAALLAPPEPPRSEPLDRDAIARALERAPLAADDEARAREEAAALLATLDAEAQRPRPPADAADRFAAVIDLARRGRARDLALRAALGRGLALALSADPELQRAGRADLVEARRLAVAQAGPADVVLADAAALLAVALDDEPRATPDSRPTNDPVARAWRTVAAAAAAVPLDDGAAALAAASSLLAVAVTSGAPFLVGATLEMVAGAAIAHGQEARAERLCEQLLGAGLPPAVTPLVGAWSALLAARRGAPLLARDRLLDLTAALDGVAAPDQATGWNGRAAARGALAARAIGSDGLAAHLGRLAPEARATRLALGADLGDELATGPAWLLTLTAEAALARPEARRRATRQALLTRLARHGPDAWPAGLALALGRLAAATFFPDEARRALELAAARGERHVEREALEALAPLLLEGAALPDAIAAVARRLAQLRALTAPAPLDDVAPLPLTPEGAARAQATLIRRAAEAARQHRTPEARWRAAVEALCGPLVDAPPSARAAADGLTLGVTRDGRWALRTADDQLAALTAPPDVAPAPLARALEALAPALIAAPSAPGDGDEDARWAHATDDALTRGEVDFDEAVIAPFKRHDLTRAQVRALVHLGLTETTGLYRALARRWRLPDDAYQRALDFLRRANAALDYRPYRRGRPATEPEF